MTKRKAKIASVWGNIIKAYGLDKTDMIKATKIKFDNVKRGRTR